MKTAYATIVLALFAGEAMTAPLKPGTSPNPALRRRQVFFVNCTTPGLTDTCSIFNTRCDRWGSLITDYPALCGRPNCLCYGYGGCDVICRAELGIEDDSEIEGDIISENIVELEKEKGKKAEDSAEQ
ncbi:hypothetical protein QIS74_06380 [Colletotrichum tabaci]|uniref:Uncharacterized protein n=1 Tax=Colletotrichum tabaci TaxID=1209068 RepID=A0AAV9TCS1_9PEZI